MVQLHLFHDFDNRGQSSIAIHKAKEMMENLMLEHLSKYGETSLTHFLSHNTGTNS